MIKTIAMAFFGVLLPVAALIVESLTGICAMSFFSPIPSGIHSLLIAVVPAGNLILLLRTSSPEYKPAPYDVIIAATVLAICSVYSIAFIPLVPIALIAIIWLGLGLCPLSPMTSLVVAGFLTRRVLRAQANTKNSGLLSAVWSTGGLCSLYCFITGILWSCLGWFPARLFAQIP
ncbi:MAG: hypothetical protein AB7W16_20610 [Candidatus Obscuribacterales bacterium]